MRAKTKEDKELQGTYEPSREGQEAVEFDRYAINPVAPKEWPPHIQKIWSDRCQDLKNTGYLAKAFIPLLRRYCFAILQAEEAETHLLRDGFVTYETGTEGQQYEVVSKWVNVLDNANKTIERIGVKFGFSPLDVQKIPAVQKKEGVEMSLLK
jgi:P27 family predicted phage terminase small subunit